MKKKTLLATLIVAVAAFSASAQIQTLVTGTNDLNTNSALVTVSSNSYVQFLQASLGSDYHIAVIMQGVSFDIDPDKFPLINGETFAGPATIQIHGDIYTPHFATLNEVPFRKAIGTNIQTLVVSPTNQNSATITVSSNSFAIIPTAFTQSSANLLVTVQDASFSYSIQNVSVNGLTFTGPATIQLQGGSPSYATVEIMPMRKSSKSQIQTLVVTPTNTNSPTIDVPTNSYATITSVDDNFDGTLVPIVDGIPFAFNPGEDKVLGFTFAGPASIQFQGDGFDPGFITVTTTRK